MKVITYRTNNRYFAETLLKAKTVKQCIEYLIHIADEYFSKCDNLTCCKYQNQTYYGTSEMVNYSDDGDVLSINDAYVHVTSSEIEQARHLLIDNVNFEIVR